MTDRLLCCSPVSLTDAWCWKQLCGFAEHSARSEQELRHHKAGDKQPDEVSSDDVLIIAGIWWRQRWIDWQSIFSPRRMFVSQFFAFLVGKGSTCHSLNCTDYTELLLFSNENWAVICGKLGKKLWQHFCDRICVICFTDPCHCVYVCMITVISLLFWNCELFM